MSNQYDRGRPEKRSRHGTCIRCGLSRWLAVDADYCPDCETDADLDAAIAARRATMPNDDCDVREQRSDGYRKRAKVGAK